MLFEFSGLLGRAYPKPGADRLRGAIYIGIDDHGESDPDEAERWVSEQPSSQAGVLQVVRYDDGGWELRMLFERPLDPQLVGPDDPLAADVAAYTDAWVNGPDLVTLPSIEQRFSVPGDPKDRTPRSAWLLFGTEPSFPDLEELEESQREAAGGVYDYLWTAAKQTEPGDLVLLYFLAPRKHVAFVARAVTRAFYDDKIDVIADKEVRSEQWWTYITPPVPIPPIPYADLQRFAGGHLNLRGRSGHYLKPEVIDAVIGRFAADGEVPPDVAQVVAPVVGLADLTHPQSIDVTEWRRIAAGALPREAHVEQHIVEPLLRFCLPEGYSWKPQYRVGGRIADYVVLDGRGLVCSVVEVKLRVRRRRDAPWKLSPDLQQLQDYVARLGCPGVLIDCGQIHLLNTQATEPHLSLDRATVTDGELAAIGRHLTGQ